MKSSELDKSISNQFLKPRNRRSEATVPEHVWKRNHVFDKGDSFRPDSSRSLNGESDKLTVLELPTPPIGYMFASLSNYIGMVIGSCRIRIPGIVDSSERGRVSYCKVNDAINLSERIKYRYPPNINNKKFASLFLLLRVLHPGQNYGVALFL